MTYCCGAGKRHSLESIVGLSGHCRHIDRAVDAVGKEAAGRRIRLHAIRQIKYLASGALPHESVGIGGEILLTARRWGHVHPIEGYTGQSPHGHQRTNTAHMLGFRP